MSLSNFGVKKIDSFFADGPYYIPEYQRNFSWGDQYEVKELWDDLLMVYRDSINEYFLGQIVVHDDTVDKKKYIIDGQQRTTTLVLLFIAIRNYFSYLESLGQENSAANKAKVKIDSLLQIIDKDDREEKLVLSELVNAFFVDKILYSSNDEINNIHPKQNEKKKLIKAYKFLYKEIESFLDNIKANHEKLEELKKYYKTICNNIKLLYVETTEESEAFMIFETLNARGRDLETADLLKNYFFRISNDNIENIKGNWQILSNKFENESITSYIRCLWNSEHEFVRDKMLYKKITNYYKTPKSCLELSKKIEENTDLYLSLIDPENKHCFQGGRKKELESLFLELSDLKVKTFYPVVLAYYSQNKDSEKITDNLIRITEAIEKLIVRDILIAMHSPAGYEPLFANLAKNISDMTITSVDDIIKVIRKASISDEEFKQHFNTYKGSGSAQGKAKIRFLLRKINNSLCKETCIKRNNNEVHIEHIMPVTKGDWDISDEVHSNCLWKLGNLTLLMDEINEDIKNSLFSIKVNAYKDSDVKITNELYENYEDWNEETIRKRQECLYDLAKDIWKF